MVKLDQHLSWKGNQNGRENGMKQKMTWPKKYILKKRNQTQLMQNYLDKTKLSAFQYYQYFDFCIYKWSLFVKTWAPFTKGCFMGSLDLIVPLVLKKNFFLYFVNIFSPFRDNLPLKKDKALPLNKLNFPSLKDALF